MDCETLEEIEVINLKTKTDKKPFWNCSVQQKSTQIWLPTQLEPTGSTQYWKTWKPVEEQEVINHPIQSSLKVDPLDDFTHQTRKVRFYPNKLQKELFNKCFNIHRYFYNKAVHEINTRFDSRKKEFIDSPTCVIEACNQEKDKDSFLCKKHQKRKLPWKLGITYFTISKLILKSDKEIKNTPDEWQSEVPYDTRNLAIKAAVSAYTACIANLQNGNIKKFRLQYKQKNRQRRIFWVDDKALKIRDNNCFIFLKRLKTNSQLRLRNKMKDRLPDNNTSDLKIQYVNGAYYLLFSSPKEQKEVDQKHDIIALDPGVRTFQTGYSPDNMVIKMGEERTAKLRELHKKIDHLRSIKSHYKGKTKRNIEKRLDKLSSKVSNIVHDLHCQSASMLTKTFKNIFLPEFGTSKVLDGSKLHSSTNRMMGTLSFYKFKCKLQQLGDKYGSNVFIVNESHTTMTCTNCGYLNKNVNGLKTIVCPDCNISIDRDISGSRNIYLKNLEY